MFNGFITFLTSKKQAYTGKPSSSIKYVNGRYIIDGEEDSEDDVPPPPPPVKKKDPVVQEIVKKEEPKELSGEGLTRVAFGGALANRGRGRGRGN